jgi:hypothetical protein
MLQRIVEKVATAMAPTVFSKRYPTKPPAMAEIIAPSTFQPVHPAIPQTPLRKIAKMQLESVPEAPLPLYSGGEGLG